MSSELTEKVVKLARRAKNTTLYVPIHPNPIDDNFDAYANTYLFGILEKRTGFSKIKDPNFKENSEKMKLRAELEKIEQREQKHKEFLLRRQNNRSPRRKGPTKVYGLRHTRSLSNFDRVSRGFTKTENPRHTSIKSTSRFSETAHSRYSSTLSTFRQPSKRKPTSMISLWANKIYQKTLLKKSID